MAIYSAVPPPPQLGGPPVQAQADQPPPSSPGPAAASTSNPTPAAAPNAAVAASPPPAPAGPPPNSSNLSAGGIDIESWTVSALQSLRVSPVARGTGSPLAIPLDEPADLKKPAVSFDPRARSTAITPPPRPPSRRDSQRRREALLKGKEGSRQRRRWENDRLMHVPNVQPPEPRDWEHQPTHPVIHVPYQIAAAWDLRIRADVESKKAAAARQKQAHTRTLGDDNVPGRVPRELFLRAKKAPVVRTWVRSLEEPVRRYLVTSNVAKEPVSFSDDEFGPRSDDDDDSSTEDEEIVFVGRNGSMRDGWKKARREGARSDEDSNGMIFDALGDDEESGAFKRWITHSISAYYGLNSHSAFIGEPKRKVVYVALKAGRGTDQLPAATDLPRPLWQLC